MLEDSLFLMDESGALTQAGDGVLGDLSLRLAGYRNDLKSRVDAKTGVTQWGRMAASRRRLDGYMASCVQRSDAFNPGIGGGVNVGELTHRMTAIMEERLPPLSADKLFYLNSEPKPGMEDYTQTRVVSTGRVTVWAGGMADDIPEIQVGQASMRAPFIYYASSFSVDFLSGMRTDIMGMNQQLQKTVAIRRIMGQQRNRWAFYGSADHGLLGFIGHPFVDKAVSQVPYNSTSSASDIFDDMNYWLQYALRASGTAYTPDTVALSVDVYSYLASTRMSATDKTKILDDLKSANPHITNWVMAPELDNINGVAAAHAMLLYTKGSGGKTDHSVELVEAMPPTLLAPEHRSLGTKFYIVGGFGGLNHIASGGNMVVFLTGRT